MTFMGLVIICFIATIVLYYILEYVDWKCIIRGIINKIKKSQHKR